MTAIDDVTRRAAPWVEGLARAGYAAKGIVYVLVGVLTATAAFYRGGGVADRSTAFSFVLDQPFGKPLLALIAIGLVGYAIWKLGSAIADWEQKGNEPKGLAARSFSALVGLIYAGIALEVVRILMSGGSGSGGSDTKTQHWAARALEAPLGRWLVAIAGVAIVGYGIQQLTAAWKAKLSERLRLGSLSPSTRKKIVAISRFGIAARGVVFAIVGVSLVSAALSRRAGDARGTAGAMRSISEQPFGDALLIVVAIGVAAYGVYALINARYRLIRAR